MLGRVIELKLGKLYGKDKASIEELLSNRAGRTLLPYEIVFNDEMEWEAIADQIQDFYHKACVIYTNYRWLTKRRKPLQLVHEKLPDSEIRRFFEILRALE